MLDTFLSKQTLQTAKANDALFAPLLIAFSKAESLPEYAKIPRLPPAAVKRLEQEHPLADQIKVKQLDDGLQITFPIKKGFDVKRAVQDILAAHKRTQMLYSSTLLNLSSSVELFFSRLLHEFFTLHPAAIGTKDKVFSFEDLSSFDTIADARAHYVLDKIENLLRGSLTDWLKFARETLKLSMGYLKDDLAILEETFQRRNLIVHNGGIVNSIYLSRVPKPTRKEVKLGDDLSPNRAYLNDAIDLWERACILIAAELWKRVEPDDTERASILADISYKHLLAERWRISEAISDFLIRDKSMPEPVQLNAQLNLWQCRKWTGRWATVEDEVSKFDIAAKSPRYQLPVLALQNKNDEFFEALPRAIRSGELTRQDLKEWPIFSGMREDPRFGRFAGRRKATRRTKHSRTLSSPKRRKSKRADQ